MLMQTLAGLTCRQHSQPGGWQAGQPLNLEIQMDKPIYLDYNATTPVDPEVIQSMLPVLNEVFGNPSSSHTFGKAANDVVEKARSQVARLLNCTPQEIIFTSGGTESNNHAIRGIVFNNWGVKNPQRAKTKVITSPIEHPAVLEVCRWLKTQAINIVILPVDSSGLVDPNDLESVIDDGTMLVTVMHANNEVGTLQPVKELARITHDHGAIFHTDAAQSVGKVDVDVKALDVDLLSIAGHKLYAPKGVGVLYIREGVQLTNLMFGAGHEAGRRPGTENVLEISGLGKACHIASRDLPKLTPRLQNLRDRLHRGLENSLGSGNIRLNGHPTKRLPNTLNIGFKDIPADQLLTEIGGEVAASAGSACHADSVQVSPVLTEMGVPLEVAKGSVRFSVGRGTSDEHVDLAVEAVVRGINRLKKGRIK
jgi:cysteine desulfurase